MIYNYINIIDSSVQIENKINDNIDTKNIKSRKESNKWYPVVHNPNHDYNNNKTILIF